MVLWEFRIIVGDNMRFEEFRTPGTGIREAARKAALLAEEHHAKVIACVRSTGEYTFVCRWEDGPRPRICWEAEDAEVLKMCRTRHKT